MPAAAQSPASHPGRHRPGSPLCLRPGRWTFPRTAASPTSLTRWTPWRDGGVRLPSTSLLRPRPSSTPSRARPTCQALQPSQVPRTRSRLSGGARTRPPAAPAPPSRTTALLRRTLTSPTPRAGGQIPFDPENAGAETPPSGQPPRARPSPRRHAAISAPFAPRPSPPSTTGSVTKSLSTFPTSAGSVHQTDPTSSTPSAARRAPTATTSSPM